MPAVDQEPVSPESKSFEYFNQNKEKKLEELESEFSQDMYSGSWEYIMAKFVPLSQVEQNNQLIFVSIGAGFASGLIKTVEGVVSLGAELVDLGADSNTAADVEQFFDEINIFEDTAQDRVAGKLVETLTQIGIPGTAGFKAATKLADKAIKAKKAGKYANL